MTREVSFRNDVNAFGFDEESNGSNWTGKIMRKEGGVCFFVSYTSKNCKLFSTEYLSYKGEGDDIKIRDGRKERSNRGKNAKTCRNGYKGNGKPIYEHGSNVVRYREAKRGTNIGNCYLETGVCHTL